MIRLAWSTILGGHGYGHVGEKLKKSLTSSGAILLPESEFGWDALIDVHPPTAAWHIGTVSHRPDLVFHTMCETDALPDSWATILNKAGLVWVPSRWCEEVFRENGVTVPIIRTHYGVEMNAIRRVGHDGPFRVLAWGDALYSRKNILTAMKAFTTANLPDAVLEVKLNLEPINLPPMHWMDDDGKYHENIVIYHDNWSRQQLVKWLHSGDVGVYLSGGEGYGLIPKEMMATALPVISVIHTGLSEYLIPSVVYHVPARQEKSEFFGETAYTERSTEYVPDFDAVVGWLQYVYHHREEAYTVGFRGSLHVQNFTWERVGQQALDLLCTHFGVTQ